MSFTIEKGSVTIEERTMPCVLLESRPIGFVVDSKSLAKRSIERTQIDH